MTKLDPQTQLSKAIKIVVEAFEHKLDKGGYPYILHCLHVMNSVSQDNDFELMAIAVMHDLVEDTWWSYDDLTKLGFSDRVVVAVRLLTHNKEDDYDTYIRKLSFNEDARVVKMADLRHNSDITRMKGLRKKDFERLEKYNRAYAYLSE